MSCYCNCSVALPHGAMGWTAVCIVVFSDHYHLLYDLNCKILKNINLRTDSSLSHRGRGEGGGA